ncbi:efflux transporter outer membrane subunit [Dyella sp. Tek66A03]|uniref:efflux transporter outer membrane subunit n=1 Tax=Dyella sp. Tek66A03 TaxID=3458298 RepID=UPI00403EEE6C
MNTTIQRHLRTGLLAAAIALSGCAFAPPTRPPAAPSPARYTATPAPSVTVDAGGVQRFESGAAVVPDWWHQYGSATLDAWVEEGLHNSPSLEAARHTLEAVHQQYRAQVGDTMLPSLDAQGQTSRQRALGIPGLGPPTNLYNVYAGQLSLNYDFDLFGSARYGVKHAAAQVDVQKYQVVAARRALAANIVIAAIQASAMAEQVEAATRAVELAKTQADLVEKAYALGAASHEDVLTARQNAAVLAATLPSLRTQAIQARHALAVYMGRTPDQAPEVPALSEFHLPATVPVSVPSDLLRQRPDVLAAEANLRAASAQVGVATANLFPHVSLSASLGSATFKDAALFASGSKVWSAGLSLAQPIFHGGALRAERKAAIADYDASVAQYRQTVLNAFRNVADTLVALDQDADALQAAATAAEASRQSFEDTQARYRLGAASHPATLASEQRWQDARQSEIQAAAARLVDSAALYQAMGEPPANDNRESSVAAP